MPDNHANPSPKNNGQRCCAICGEAIYSRAKYHPACAATLPASETVRKAPQKQCCECGSENHVRQITCQGCGAMF